MLGEKTLLDSLIRLISGFKLAEENILFVTDFDCTITTSHLYYMLRAPRDKYINKEPVNSTLQNKQKELYKLVNNEREEVTQVTEIFNKKFVENLNNQDFPNKNAIVNFFFNTGEGENNNGEQNKQKLKQFYECIITGKCNELEQLKGESQANKYYKFKNFPI